MGKTLTYLIAAIIILVGLGLSVIIGLSFIVQAQTGTGLVFLIIGIGFIIGGAYLIYLTGRGKMGAEAQNVTLKVDLPANVNLDTLKCKSCGGTLTMDNIQMVAGAPVVNCPYCHTTYQLTEDPKW